MSFCLSATGSIITTATAVPKKVTVGSSSGPWMSVNTVLPASPEVLMISKYPIIEISDGSNRKVVSIMSDGSVVVPDDVTHDEAAKNFWRAIRKLNPFENETRIYRTYIRELERENHELKARIDGETILGSHLDDDGEGTG